MEIGLIFLAGLLITLSPCVLPILPMIVNNAFQVHRMAPICLATGLVVAFTIMGIGSYWLTHYLLVDLDLVRKFTSFALILFGLLLISHRLKYLLGQRTAALISWLNHSISHMALQSLFGQFILGLALGILWLPCIGPALGLALSLASSQKTMFAASTMLLIFGVGACTPLLVISYGARYFVMRHSKTLAHLTNLAEPVIGLTFILFGVSVLMGWDRILLTFITSSLPISWLKLISRY